MLQNYSKLLKKWMVLLLPIWVLVSFYVSQLVLGLIIGLLGMLNLSSISISHIVSNAIIATLLYVMTLAMVIGVPWLVYKQKTSLQDIGLTRLPSWTDIIITPAGLIVYFIFSSILILLATSVLPWFDINQIQDTGFRQISFGYEYVLAFVTLVVVAPVAEEILFRGYLYGKLKKVVPVWGAILVTSLLFGFVHGAWNLAFDTFALSVIMCLLRDLTGSVWASILLHMLKNGIAFYILFINPAIFTILK